MVIGGVFGAVALLATITIVTQAWGPSADPIKNAAVTPTGPATRPSTTAPSTTPSTAPAEPTPTDRQVVTQNRLYRTGAMPPSKCAEPRARPTSLANVRAYYRQFLSCLDRGWRPTVVKAGYAFRSPNLIVFAGRSMSSPCGPASSTGYYCGGNETIYLSATKDIGDYRNSSKLWTRTRMAFVIGHEYGHHVQQLTGLLEASWNRQHALGNRAPALEENRRRELQASCFSAVYLGADRGFFPVRGSWLTRWRWTVYHHGDQWNPTRDHGDKKNHGDWSLRGFNSSNPAMCNTFTASARAVS